MPDGLLHRGLGGAGGEHRGGAQPGHDEVAVDHHRGAGQESRLDHVQAAGAQPGAGATGQGELLQHQQPLGELQLGVHHLPEAPGHDAHTQPAAEHGALPLPVDRANVQLSAAHASLVQLEAVEETLPGLLEVLELAQLAGDGGQRPGGLLAGQHLLREAPAHQVGGDQSGGTLGKHVAIGGRKFSVNVMTLFRSLRNSISPRPRHALLVS